VSHTAFWLATHYRPERRLLMGQRLQIRPDRFRIADLCLLAEHAPRESITITPPCLCIEILSKDDRMSEVMERFDDYFGMGVPVCRLIDPTGRRAWVVTAGLFSEPADGVLRAGEIAMPAAEAFNGLN
jgi:Uma2 family endonuclease